MLRVLRPGHVGHRRLLREDRRVELVHWAAQEGARVPVAHAKRVFLLPHVVSESGRNGEGLVCFVSTVLVEKKHIEMFDFSYSNTTRWLIKRTGLEG